MSKREEKQKKFNELMESDIGKDIMLNYPNVPIEAFDYIWCEGHLVGVNSLLDVMKESLEESK